MGTASGAFTALFGIDFPKAIYKGNVLGLSVRAPKSFYDGGLYSETQADSGHKKLEAQATQAGSLAWWS